MNSVVQANFGSGKTHALAVLVEGRAEKLAVIDRLRLERMELVRKIVQLELQNVRLLLHGPNTEQRAWIAQRQAAVGAELRNLEDEFCKAFVLEPAAKFGELTDSLVRVDAEIAKLTLISDFLNDKVSAILAAIRRPRFFRWLVAKYRAWHLRHGAHPPHNSSLSLNLPEAA